LKREEKGRRGGRGEDLLRRNTPSFFMISRHCPAVGKRKPKRKRKVKKRMKEEKTFPSAPHLNQRDMPNNEKKVGKKKGNSTGHK